MTASPGLRPVTTLEPLLVVLAILTLCGFVPLWLTAMSPVPPGSSSVWWLAIVVVVWSGLRISKLFGEGSGRLYSIVFWVFVYIFLGMAPLLQIRLGIDPDTTPDVFPGSRVMAFVVVFAGLASFEVGTWVARHRSPSQQRPARQISHRKSARFGTFSLLLVLGIVSLVGPAKYFAGRGVLDRAKELALGSSPVASVVFSAAAVFPLIAGHAQFRLWQNARRSGVETGFPMMGLALVLATLATVNIFTSSRITFGTNLLSLAVLAGALGTAIRVRAVIATLLAGLVLIFPFADLFRGGGRQQPSSGIRQLATSGDFDAFAQIANTVALVDAHGITWGRQALGVVLFWFPRSLWPSKPIDTGSLVAQFRGYGFDNLSAPLWAESYINLGILGVLLALGVLGYILQIGDERLGAALESGGIASVAGAVLPFYMIIILRGSLLQATGTAVAIGLALWLTSSKDAAVTDGGPRVRPGTGGPQ